MKEKILVINPGSTSTKIAVFIGEDSTFLKTLKHSNEELDTFENIASQFEFRKTAILNELKKSDVATNDFNAIVGRGGLVKPIESGVYEVNDALKRDLTTASMLEHASNLGGLIAADIAKDIPGARAFIADPVVVDELSDVARITGLPQMPRKSIFHALNQKAVAKRFAREIDKKYEDINVIVAHLGGGISIGAHEKGRVVDVNNAIDGYGPFSPERSGTLPTGALVDACFSGKYTHKEMRKLISGAGGFVAHLGTNQAYDVEKKVEAGDPHFTLIHSALAYQIAKNIGGCAAALKGEVDGIIITGGIAYDKILIGKLKEMLTWISPEFKVYPGEDEMQALADNGLAVLRGETTCKVYK